MWIAPPRQLMKEREHVFQSKQPERYPKNPIAPVIEKNIVLIRRHAKHPRQREDSQGDQPRSARHCAAREPAANPVRWSRGRRRVGKRVFRIHTCFPVRVLGNIFQPSKTLATRASKREVSESDST